MEGEKGYLEQEYITATHPVSNLLFLDKARQLVVVSLFQWFLDEANCLDPFQSIFRPGYGNSVLCGGWPEVRSTQLECVPSCWSSSISWQLSIPSTIVSFWSVCWVGLGGMVLQWMCSFLSGRTQKVVFGNCCSDPEIWVSTGVGSFLYVL